MSNDKRFLWDVRPVALNENVVSGEKYRFTVLTDKLIRMEYSDSGKFEDRASQYIFYRDFPKCEFDIKINDGILTLETESLILTYSLNKEFSKDTLELKLKCEPASSWKFGEYFETLGGTVKTLDMINGSIPLEDGVCSRNGFSVIDDSNTLVLGDDGWVELREADTKDVYFFGYGFAYTDAIKDFYKLTGAPPLLPDYALGNWWSRYYSYTQEEYIALMEEFKAKNIPFSVGVIDMDWHTVNIPEELRDEEIPEGWCGYSWNKDLFPDYKAFLKYLNENNLKTSLNLHPHAGVRRHEDQYEEMAKRCGIDPKSGKRVPFDILSKEFMANYFDVLHHPYEEDGVNFWWMDWQQGTDYWWIHEKNENGELQNPLEVLDPLWMLNHLHILDISRNGKRPMFFSRFSGAGSHRYPIGFSGDSFCTWKSLEFQPYFTATASNIGYSWWSHDIGGHQKGYHDDELYTRWLQLGVFSPINRLHSTKNNFMRKEPWCYTLDTEKNVENWLRLRHKLFPYIYTMNYRNHAELLPLVQPMYYSHPKCSGAYEVPNQFWFGSELIVAPITEPNNKVVNLGKAKVWLPDGEWFDFFDGSRYASFNGRKLEMFRDLKKYPVLAKAGAIVPMAEYKDNKLGIAEKSEIVIFPSADNTFTLYEDEGEYNRYKEGYFAKTEMSISFGEKAVFEISPAIGHTELLPKTREWKLSFRGFNKSANISVAVDGKAVDAPITYSKETNTLSVTVKAAPTSRVIATVMGETLVHDNSDILDKCYDILQFSTLSTEVKTQIYNNVKQNLNDVRLFKKFTEGKDDNHQFAVDAISEQLTKTKDEFLGEQIK